MDFQFSEREALVRETVREWAEKELPPRMEKMEETGEFPVELVKPMADMGINGLITPEEYGGLGMGALARIIVLEELGRVCPAIPMAMQAHHMCTNVLANHGDEEQKQKYLPRLARGETLGLAAITDPYSGWDAVDWQSRARLEGNRYILNGRKCFVTNANVADVWVVAAVTGEEGEGGQGITTFIVEKDFPGARLGRKENKVGLRGADMGELVFQDCEVPVANRLGEEGQGMDIAAENIANCGRPGMASVALGIMGAALAEAAKFASERMVHGRPIAELPQVQARLAAIYRYLELARLATYRVGWMLDQGMRVDTESALAKSFACEAAGQAAHRAIEIHGSYGIMKEDAVQRLLRDAVAAIPASGSEETANLILSRAALNPLFS